MFEAKMLVLFVFTVVLRPLSIIKEPQRSLILDGKIQRLVLRTANEPTNRNSSHLDIEVSHKNERLVMRSGLKDGGNEAVSVVVTVGQQVNVISVISNEICD